MRDTLRYHISELEIARDKSRPEHIMPHLRDNHRVILDVGCGMGQTLIGLDIPEDTLAYGIDVDADAIEAGKKICPPNVTLSTGSGENMEFANESFDLILCRVALPYMDVHKALSEMYRTLKPGGEVWLVLHPLAMYKQRFFRSLKSGRIKDAAYCGLIFANSFVQHRTAKHVRFGGVVETFQSRTSITQDLIRSGFTDVNIAENPFVAHARKPLRQQMN